MQNPKVSILVPVYKVEKQIARCVKSLFEQTFDSIEYIFVDDASPDCSIDILQKILKRYSHRQNQVKIIRHSLNCGVWKARTTALENATGDYIWYVDSDDYIAHDAVEKLYHAAENRNADIVSFNFADVFADGSQKERKRLFDNRENMLKKMIQGKEFPSMLLHFVRRDLYIKNHILPFPGVNFGEDYGITPRLFYYAEKIIFLPDIFYYYVHDNSNSYCSCWKRSYPEERTLVYEQYEALWGTRYQDELRCNKIHQKCSFYRMYALSENSPKEDLKAITNWCPEISFRTLLRCADLPYMPIIILAYLRLDFLLKLYARSCKFLYRFLISIRNRK